MGSRTTPIREEGPYLQNDPVTFLGSEVQGGLSHDLLSLPQRHVVKVPIVASISEFFTYKEYRVVIYLLGLMICIV